MNASKMTHSASEGLDEPHIKKLKTMEATGDSSELTPGAHAGDVIKLRFVSCEEESDSSPLLPVVFTHQIFPGERITECNSKDLSIIISFTNLSLDCLVEIQTSGDIDKTEFREHILTSLSPALPDCYVISSGDFTTRLDANKKFIVPGVKVHDYSSKSQKFSLYRVTGADRDGCDFHNRAQKLALWYIETADSIDITDDRWEVIYIFEEFESRNSAFVGYFTLFNFRNPMKGISIRICQALIIPLYQRQGIGYNVMKYIYENAQKRLACYEITVEDPAPTFKFLRDFTDASICRQNNIFSEAFKSGAVRPLSSTEVDMCMNSMKLIRPQILSSYEILLLERLNRTDDQVMRDYRIMVKKRLYSEKKDTLSKKIDIRKEKLQEMYEDLVEERYMPILRRLLKQ